MKQEPSTTEPWEVVPQTPPTTAATPRRDEYSEDIQRVQVEPEDRLAFRVGVNLITLLLLGVGAYFLVRYLW